MVASCVIDVFNECDQSPFAGAPLEAAAFLAPFLLVGAWAMARPLTAKMASTSTWSSSWRGRRPSRCDAARILRREHALFER